jgi:Mannosyltransferase putative
MVEPSMTTPYQAIANRCAAPASYPAHRFQGRGIVICAGGERYFTCAWVLIWLLRRVHRTSLPIQVWHLGRGEMSEEMQLLLSEEGVEVVDAGTVVARHPARLAGGWPLKPYAIAQSRFREVLYLDADTVPLVPPHTAFEWLGYRETGLLLWPDIVDLKDSNPVWGRLKLQPMNHISIDSGILVADKAKVWDVLDLAVLMNEYCDDLYDVLYGDKDTYLLSAKLLNHVISIVQHRPFVLDGDFVQRDEAGEPFIHHRTISKWLLHYPNRPVAEPSLTSDCQAALNDLRNRWSGAVFNPPGRSAAAHIEETQLIAQRTFRFEPVAGGPHDIELLPGGRIGGALDLHRHWAVIDHGSQLKLQFFAAGEPVETFEKLNDGTWRGFSCAPGFELRLTPILSRPQTNTNIDRGRRSGEYILTALAEAALFTFEYDEERGSKLAAALSLLNEVFDDIPELLGKYKLKPAVSTGWQSFLAQLSIRLAQARDRRLALLQPNKAIGPRALNPLHYAGPLEPVPDR